MKKVNEVSQLAGVSKRTLQFYDDEGLLPAERSEGNYRLYDDAALERLWQILVYREMELDLKEIKYLMTLSDKERNQFLREKIKKLKQQIKHLDGQMEFISYVQNHGMLPIPPECERKKRNEKENSNDVIYAGCCMFHWSVWIKRFDANSRGKHKPGGIQGNKMANK